MSDEIASEIKILLLGESNVGKTSIFNRFISNTFDKNGGSTIGVDFETKILAYKNKKYSIRLFDTAGQERFRSITQNYYHMGDAFLFVFDLSNEHSFKSIPGWIESVKESIENPKFIILANKDDLKDKEKLSDEVINSELGKYNIIKTSALKNINIAEAFEHMINLVVYNTFDIKNEKLIENNQLSKNNSFRINKKKKRKGMKCC